VGKVNAILNKITEFGKKGVDYVKALPKDKLWLYIGIAAGVILLLIIVGAVAKGGSNPYAASNRAYRRYCRRMYRLKRSENYYRPRKRRVRYIKTKAPKKSKVQQVYVPADRSAMLATGIFGVSLGIMAHRAIMEEKRDFYL